MSYLGFAGIENATDTRPETRVLFVPGIPAPAGSKTGFPIKRKDGRIGVAMSDASKRSKPWKTLIAAHALDGWRDMKPLLGPVAIQFDFWMPRPKAHRRGNGEIKAGAPLHHTSKPDALKLARAAEDSLSGIAYLDDAQIAEEHIYKCYGEKPGVTIRVWSLK